MPESSKKARKISETNFALMSISQKVKTSMNAYIYYVHSHYAFLEILHNNVIDYEKLRFILRLSICPH